MTLIAKTTTIPTNANINAKGTTLTKVVAKGVTVWEKVIFTYKEFNYTGKVQPWTVPVTGTYQLEVYGAQGGSGRNWMMAAIAGGKGGYAKGTKYLTAGTVLYIVVGGQGGNAPVKWDCVDEDEDPIPAPSGYWNVAGGYNGGSVPSSHLDGMAAGGGGGATHIATVNGLLSSLSAYKNNTSGNYILIVAGGGGGANDKVGFNGGGTTGGGGSGVDGVDGGGGTQTIGGARGYQDDSDGDDNGDICWGNAGGFGYGASPSTGYTSGAGAGWYGGGSGGGADEMARGGGGSGYIGHVTSGSMTSGARSGNGYAKITLL